MMYVEDRSSGGHMLKLVLIVVGLLGTAGAVYAACLLC
jgi:hypothetical protein